MPKRYFEDLKMEVTRRHEQGESAKSLSQELSIAQSTIHDWLKKFHCTETSVRSYTPADFDKLVRHVRKLEHEFEVIQRTGLITDVPLQKRLALLEEIHQEEKYSVYELCEALEVSRGTFYNHIFRRADRSAREWEQAELTRNVQQIFDDSGQRYGAEKIRIVLEENGIHVGKKRVLAICGSWT